MKNTFCGGVTTRNKVCQQNLNLQNTKENQNANCETHIAGDGC